MTGDCDRAGPAIKRALVSVHDKTGIVRLARFLAEQGVEILSTGGTADTLRAAGLTIGELSALTGFRERLGGRVKSLHTAVHAGILARRNNARDLEDLQELGIGPIDLVVVNFYPFADRSPDRAAAIELIDIGGPAMVRSAAKNHEAVTVVTDPGEYPGLIEELTGGGATSLAFRQRRAARAFSRTAAYDAAIADWLWREAGEPDPPARLVSTTRRQLLAYGENPHQRASLHRTGPEARGLASASQLGGKPPGYNNLLDADAAMSLAAEFDPEAAAACAIIKHGTPCGVALAKTAAEAFVRARACDPRSAFGGVVALNRRLDSAAAIEIAGHFVEVVIAPGVSERAAAALKARPGIRILSCNGADFAVEQEEIRSVCGGLLLQTSDASRFDRAGIRTATAREPTGAEWVDLEFAWKVARHARSNAVVLASGRATAGIGAGQTSRVAAAAMAAGNIRRPAADKACLVAASDGFFPFADGIEAIAAAGATAVIQPGGSRNDADVIGAADRLGLAMVFTGSRHFRH